MKKIKLINQIICLFLLTFCFMFTACPEIDTSADNKGDNKGKTGSTGNGDNDEYNNPNAGAVKELTFSHDSGLHTAQFNLTITAAEGSSVYYTTDGSVPSPGKTGTTKYNAAITVKNRNGEANVLATPVNHEKFYMVPDDPRGNVPPVYQQLTKDKVPKATVIRAIAVDSSGKKSGVATKTYFIGSNLSGYENIRVVSLVSDPDNLVSESRGIMVRGKSTNRWGDFSKEPDKVYNFQRKGTDWEREAYLEIFEGNNRSKSALSTGVGIRVRGGYSRGVGQKSFSVYFKEQYGIKNLKNYDLIPKDTTLGTTGAVKADGKTPVTQYKGFMLRNGANDIEYTKFYDVFLQDLLSDRSFATQASVPCIVYLNGEYWGPYNFQERYSDNHTEYKYGVDKDNVISYDNGELDDGNPGEEALFKTMVGYASKDMSNPTNYAEFCNLVDIDNFIDYWAAEIYIYNEDWPQNNYRIWRTRNVESGNPYGDTKWRYEMFDTEFAMGIYNSGRLTGQKNMDAFDKILNYYEHKNHENNKLFKALLANPDFCKKFVNTMLDLYNVNFHPNNYEPKLNKYEAVYRPLMNGYFDRWGYPGTWTSAYQNKVDDAKNYLSSIRNAMVNNYLPKYFGGYTGIANIGISGSNLRDVTLSVTGVSGATIKINSVTPNLAGSWTGKYYSAVPITVTASPAPSGYEFDGWTVTGGIAASSAQTTTTVTITGNAQITAKYKLTGSADVPVTSVNLNNSSLSLVTGNNSTLNATVNPSNATYKTVFWSSDDPSVANVDNTGKVTAIRNGSAIITASTVEGVNATCSVTVTAVVTSVNLDPATLKLIIGGSKKLTANILPSTAPNKQTTWNSSDPSVATVSNDGTVTAKDNGTATITVTTVDGSKTATCTVSVKAATVLLDLTAKLNGLSPQVINDWGAFNSLFNDIPIDSGGDVGSNLDVNYEIINEGGVKKLKINAYALWGPGLDITDSGIDFQEGDIIEVKGKFTKKTANGVVLNMDNSGWQQLQGWYSSDPEFQKTFTLTGSDVNSIKSNNTVRIRPDGVSPYSGRDPNGIAIIILEQVKVSGYRD